MVVFDDVVGFDSLKRRMRTRFERFITGDWNKNINSKKPHGVILTGEPGVGKSYFIESLIGEYIIENELFKYMKIDKTVTASKENNGTAKVVNDIFKLIRTNPQYIYILHIEEADDIFISRRKVNRSHANELTSAWLDNMEGYKTPLNYYIVATTNYIGRWDDAIIDRFELVYHAELPDMILRKQLIEKVIISNFDICNVSDDDLIRWSKQSHGLTGRDFIKIQIRLEDLEFEIHKDDPFSKITPMTISMEISKQIGFKTQELNSRRIDDEKRAQYGF